MDLVSSAACYGWCVWHTLYLDEVLGEGGEGRGEDEVEEAAVLLRCMVAQVQVVLNVVVRAQEQQFL